MERAKDRARWEDGQREGQDREHGGGGCVGLVECQPEREASQSE